ncbi:MAG TPA: SRPBCC family protein [Acidobacteriaceae bacterium]|nr:SRPBCC family protein [Acidobacteriaceae bacterium]
MADAKSISDRIEKQIELRAPVGRVWRALSDHREFGEWFRVKLEAPFVEGERARGKILHPGYEHLVWQAVIQRMEPERYFSFTWHPFAVDANADYEGEIPTLVEFWLEATQTGTLLRLSESGFDKVPAERRAEAFLRNDGGWTQQMKNIEAYVGRS